MVAARCPLFNRPKPLDLATLLQLTTPTTKVVFLSNNLEPTQASNNFKTITINKNKWLAVITQSKLQALTLHPKCKPPTRRNWLAALALNAYPTPKVLCLRTSSTNRFNRDNHLPMSTSKRAVCKLLASLSSSKLSKIR